MMKNLKSRQVKRQVKHVTPGTATRLIRSIELFLSQLHAGDSARHFFIVPSGTHFGIMLTYAEPYSHI
jgi:hypothetical protein